MEDRINLEDITDIKELKSMAYDELSKLNQAQHNIQLIEQRITQVSVAKAEEDQSQAPGGTRPSDSTETPATP